jgi:hypothetical protein
MTRFNPLHATANRLGFKIAKAAFAALIEDLRNGFSFISFDVAVNIGKGPAEFLCERSPYRRFSHRHKPDKVKPGSTL